MKKFISLLLSTLIVFGAYATFPVLVTEAATTATTIVLRKNSENLYILNSINIPSVIQNGHGATTYTSSNKKVAEVSSTGKVKGLKKGTAIITITNNGVSVNFKVNVKNPKLNKSNLTLKTDKTQNIPKTFKLKILGKVGKAKFTSSNKKIAKVSTNGKVTAKKVGTAVITVNTNGIKLKCYIKVKAPTLLEKHIQKGNVKLTLKQKVKSVTYNIGEKTKNICKTYTLDSNMFACYSKKKLATFTEEMFEKATQKIYGSSENEFKVCEQIKKCEKYKTSNPKVLKVSKGGKLTIVGTGNATITVAVPTKTIKVKYHITKDKEKMLNGKRAICCYSPKDLYNALKDTFYNYTIKGEKGYYTYYICFFDNDINIESLAIKDFKDSGDTFGAYLEHNNKDVSMCIDFKKFDKINARAVYVVEELYPEDLTIFKELYNALQDIIKDKNITECKTNYEKIIKFNEWTAENTTYDKSYSASLLAKFIIIDKIGTCGNYASALEYFSLVEKIPCLKVYNNKANHAWNVVEDNGKWYNCDLLSGNLFEGSDNYWLLPDGYSNPLLSLDNNQIEKENSEHFFDVLPGTDY